MPSLPRRPLIAALAQLPLPAMAQSGGPAPSPPGTEWRFAALFPQTGPLALLGDEGFRGLELAAEERSAAGGLLGRPVRLLKADAADAPKAAAELRRLIAEARPHAAFGTCAAHLSFAATQVAELAGLPFVELGATADQITERGFRTLFRTAPRASDLAQLMVGAIPGVLAAAWGTPADTLRVALLHEDGLFGQSIAAAAEPQLKDRGLEQVERIATAARGAELSPIVARLRAVGADIVLHAGYPNDILLFYRALREAAWRPRMVIGAGSGYSLVDTAQSLGPEFDGTLTVDVPQYAVNAAFAPGIAPFAELYQRRYGSPPRSGDSLAAYAGARIAFDAMQRGGAMERDRVRAAMLATDLPEGAAANGWGARFDDKGQNLRARLLLGQWQGGRLVTIGPAEAAAAALRPGWG